MMPKKSKILFVLFSVTIVAITLISVFRKQPCGAIKMQMPGIHTIELQRGFYTVWIFKEWKSLGLKNSSKDVIVLSISDLASNRSISCDKFDNKISEAFEKPLNEGFPEYSVTITHTGKYRISCAQECVVAFVSSRDVSVGLNSNFNIRGLNNSANILKNGD